MKAPEQMSNAEWRKWFAQQVQLRGDPPRTIARGKYCRSCGRMGWHEGTCRNPWNLGPIEEAIS